MNLLIVSLNNFKMSFNTISPIYFYFGSILSFVLSNIFREQNLTVYYILLIIGVILFLLGLLRRIQTKR
ncbi:hypothetical protein EAG11_01575 [Flavobacterium sp. 140616W15]|nr:hypothetical protein EAG11_01575 [Flavobacterium sp. 140616W15]